MFFNVVISRNQIQTQTFTVEATSQSELEKVLLELDLAHIDSSFDEGEVDSIEYSVDRVEEVAKPVDVSFASDELQYMLDGLDNDEEEVDE